MISSLTKENWDGKVIELGGSILQGWAWGQFQESLGEKIYRFSGDDYINLAVESVLSMGKSQVYCPRGPLGNIESAMVDLKKFETDHGIIFARIEPAQAVKLPVAVKSIQPENEWLLDLEKTEEELLNAMKPKTRYNINLAQRKGVTMREGTKADLITVWQLLLETAKRNNIKLHAQNYYFKMWEALAPAHMKILLAEYQGVPLSGMILTCFGTDAIYLHGGSSSKMKEAMAPYLLHWEAIRLCKNAGIKTYNFGGIAPHNQEKHEWAGITRFKKGFGGFEVTYPGAFDLIYSPIWYNIYKQGRKLTRLIKK